MANIIRKNYYFFFKINLLLMNILAFCTSYLTPKSRYMYMHWVLPCSLVSCCWSHIFMKTRLLAQLPRPYSWTSTIQSHQYQPFLSNEPVLANGKIPLVHPISKFSSSFFFSFHFGTWHNNGTEFIHQMQRIELMFCRSLSFVCLFYFCSFSRAIFFQ